MHQVKHTAGARSHYIVGIDGLRALAVLAVMIFHIDSVFLPGGFTGVDVFFVISGYVVSSSLARESTASFVHFVLSFYARRFLRILPAIVVCLLVISFITTLIIPESWLSRTNNETALAAFFGYSNFALIWHSDGYFSPGVAYNPFVHTWSLGVEEQFYLIFPIILFVWLKFRSKKSFVGLSVNWLLFIVLTLSLFYSWYETSNSQDRAFYLLPSRFWELASGALLFKLHSKKKLLAKSQNQQRLYLLFGLIIVGLGFIFSEKSIFPFPWALLPVLGTSLLIIGVVHYPVNKTRFLSFFESRTLVYIGKTSYSLYLWHWPIFVLFRWTVGLESMQEIFLAVLLTVIAANISYHFIETPIRKNKYILNREDWQVILIGLLVVLISYGITTNIFKRQYKLSLSVTKNKTIWYPNRWPDKKPDAFDSRIKGRNMYVIGDSHAGAYGTMLQMLSDKHGVKIHSYSQGGCGMANLRFPIFREGGRCSEINQERLLKVEKLAKPGDIIFLASLRLERLGSQRGALDQAKIVAEQKSEKSIKNRALALEETIELIEKFKKKSLYIIIDAPKPLFKSPPYRCSDWFNTSNPSCESGFLIERRFLLEHRKYVMDSLLKLKSRYPEIIIWDPFPLLCRNEICSAFEGDNPLFFDADHLSAYGNRILYPSFETLVKEIWQDK